MTLLPESIALQLSPHWKGVAFLHCLHIWHKVMQEGNVSFCHGLVMTIARPSALAPTCISRRNLNSGQSAGIEPPLGSGG